MIFLIVLIVLLNTALGFMTKSFCKDVLDWWKPWAGVLVLVPPVGIFTGALVITTGITVLIMSAFVEEFFPAARDMFKSHPPTSDRDEAETKNLGDIHGTDPK